MKDKIIMALFIAGNILALSSCLKHNLDEIIDSDLCELVSIVVEHRWLTENTNGYTVMHRQQMNLSSNSPDENNGIYTSIVVPGSSSYNGYDPEAVSLNFMYMYFTISSAASCEPIDDAPTLGLPASFELNKEYKYKITAADGKTSQIYTIVFESFE